jgi:3-oxoadipate enol-lactonase
MESGFIEITGSKIYYEKAGSGDPIIFVHADALDCRQWDSQFEYFSKKFTVIRYDIRGFGKSDIPSDAPYSFSEDLRQLMDALHITKAHLVGLSLGAAVSIDFALMYPGRVRSLILADSGISGDGFDQEFIDSVNTIKKEATAGNMDRAKELWLNLPIFSRKNPAINQMVADTSGYRWYGKNQPSELNGVARLSEIHVPTLILVGEHDIGDFQRKSIVLHEKISGSIFERIPEAGHLSNMDNSKRFNEEVETFFSILPVV